MLSNLLIFYEKINFYFEIYKEILLKESKIKEIRKMVSEIIPYIKPRVAIFKFSNEFFEEKLQLCKVEEEVVASLDLKPVYDFFNLD